MSKRCSICGERCANDTTISNKKFVLYDNSPICPTCFKAYSTEDDSYLMKKIKEKLEVKK